MPRKTLRNRERGRIDPSSTKKSFGTRGSEKREVRNSRSGNYIGVRTDKSKKRESNRRGEYMEFEYSEPEIADERIQED